MLTVGTPLVDPEAAAARARAAIAYAGLDHDDVARATGMSISMVRRIVSRSSPRDATVDRLWMIADVCGVPRSFMEHGWAAPTDGSVEGRVAALEQDVTALRAEAAQRLLAQAAERGDDPAADRAAQAPAAPDRQDAGSEGDAR